MYEHLSSAPRRRLILMAVGVAVLLVVAARLALDGGSQPTRLVVAPVKAPRARARPAAALVVDVVGAVRRAGLYRLPQGARVADAVATAGGATRHADLALVNLAAPVADGQQVVVPRRQPASGAPVAAPGGAAPSGPVHLNVATAEELDALPGVGPVTAQKIIDFRQAHGPFTSVEELDAVSGIGPAKLDSLKGLVAP